MSVRCLLIRLRSLRPQSRGPCSAAIPLQGTHLVAVAARRHPAAQDLLGGCGGLRLGRHGVPVARAAQAQRERVSFHAAAVHTLERAGPTQLNPSRCKCMRSSLSTAAEGLGSRRMCSSQLCSVKEVDAAGHAVVQESERLLCRHGARVVCTPRLAPWWPQRSHAHCERREERHTARMAIGAARWHAAASATAAFKPQQSSGASRLCHMRATRTTAPPAHRLIVLLAHRHRAHAHDRDLQRRAAERRDARPRQRRRILLLGGDHRGRCWCWALSATRRRSANTAPVDALAEDRAGKSMREGEGAQRSGTC